MEAVTLGVINMLRRRIVADFDWYGSRNPMRRLSTPSSIVADFDWYGSRNLWVRTRCIRPNCSRFWLVWKPSSEHEYQTYAGILIFKNSPTAVPSIWQNVPCAPRLGSVSIKLTLLLPQDHPNPTPSPCCAFGGPEVAKRDAGWFTLAVPERDCWQIQRCGGVCAWGK